MAHGVHTGRVVDLYREHILNNNATFEEPTTDDFYTNAIRANPPDDLDRGLDDFYRSQPLHDSYIVHLRQDHIQDVV